jgi:hypothetical protein
MKAPARKPQWHAWHALALGSAAAAALAAPGCEPDNRGYAPTQPIVFSHAVHPGASRIPCQYCHFSAARGRHAGIPPAQICLGCHAQVKPTSPEVERVRAAGANDQPIAWIRVHRLPDHVYFDHSIHVSALVACETCHGPVAETARVQQWAPLTMGWCLDCHRAGDRPETTGRGGPLTECAVCHH